MRGEEREQKGGEGREEKKRGWKGGEGGEGRGEETFLVMWPRRLSALNPPLLADIRQTQHRWFIHADSM